MNRIGMSDYDSAIYEARLDDSIRASRITGTYVDYFGFDTGLRPLNLPEPSPKRLAEIRAEWKAADAISWPRRYRQWLTEARPDLLTPEELEEQQRLLDKLDCKNCGDEL